jgi:subtilisin family serine protease
MMRNRAVVVCVSLALVAGISGLLSAQAPSTAGGVQAPAQLRARAQSAGRVRVIVELKLASGRHVPEGQLRGATAIDAQRRDIAGALTRLTARLGATDRRVIHTFRTVPYVALEVGPAALAALESSSDVTAIYEDEIARPVLAQSVPLIQADQAWAAGYDGSGTTIAILDTGVDASHPFLAGKVVNEACYSSTSNVSRTTCPNGLDEQIGPGSAIPCSVFECLHGTHVSGIAAGNGDQAGQTFSGVAKGAQLMAVQVFSEITDTQACGGAAACAGAFSSDIIAGLERVYTVAQSLNVVAVNMSLGGASFATPCDNQPYKPAIDNLRSIGVATVVAAGNSGSGNTLASPACISTAISVGSTDKSNQVSSYSDVASFLSLFAPGQSITSSIPGGGYQAFSGTSMATPHVAGTWAILRQAAPGAGVSLILGALRQTGLPITDTRPVTTGVTVPRVSVFEALGAIVPVTHPAPALTSVAPGRVRAGSAPVLLTLTGTGFDAFSVAYWNGAPKPTSVVSTTQMLVQIPAADLVGGTTAQIRVSAPAPGGGTTVSLPVIVDPPPTLTVSATTVTPNAQVTVTLANGFGGASDWVSLASTSSPNNVYATFVYVGAGVTNRSWTFTMPATPGPYEFRLFLNNGYTRAATSPTVTVDASQNPVPAITSLSPSSTPAGGLAFTLTVNGSGFVASSSVRWNGTARPTTFVSATQLQAAIAAPDVAAAGPVAVTVFSPSPGGGSSSAATFNVNAPPMLTVNTTSVAPGGSVTVTLTNGAGGATDWLAFASTTAPNTSYNAYTFVGAGTTTRTWTVTAPSTAGTYEFRYFPAGGNTPTAESPAITVQGTTTTNPVPVATSLTPASAVAGSAAFTLTVNGSGFVSSSIVRWNGADRPTTFVSASQLRASIAAADIAVAGTASITVFSPTPGGGTSAALTFAIGAGSTTPPPVLSASASTVAAGSPVTVTLSNSPGGSGDWLSFAQSTAPNTGYTQFVYVGTGVTTRTWTVTAPSTPGTYEFRLFLNNGYVRAATSAPITITVPRPPTLSVSTTSAAPGASVTVTLADGYGGNLDWLALASTSAPNSTYVAFTYVGSGVTSRTWTVTMPSTPGTYEFRLFLNNGYTRAATSAVVTVGGS